MFFKRGGNRRGFFKTGEISSHTFFCLSVPCVECPSFSDYRRSMRVCVCVCIIALSHGLTWFLNEKKTNPLILLLLTESLLKVLSYLFSEKLFFIFFLLLLFVSQGEFGLIGIYHHTPSGCWVSALCVYSAIWRNGCFRWPCSFFFSIVGWCRSARNFFETARKTCRTRFFFVPTACASLNFCFPPTDP